MQRILLSLLALGLTMADVSAAGKGKKFPYQAKIDVAEELVRSGPGQNYYPTSKLRRGQLVTVHRHDLGGWVMISPPEGSFSWVPAEEVERTGDTSGVLTENDVIVRVGSELNDEHEWYQVKLNQGDSVEILSEKNLELPRGVVKMLRIKPPPHEYRWIMGKALLPTGTPVQKPLQRSDVAETSPPKIKSPLETDSDPFADGPVLMPSLKEKPAKSRQEATNVTESARQTGPDPSELETLRAKLSVIDKEFHDMIDDDPATWDLNRLEQQYQQLHELTELPAFQKQVQQRLDAVDRYAKIKTEYEEFVRVTTETKQRDAQLMSLKNQPQNAPLPLPTPAPAPLPQAAPAKFDGAGIVQRSASNIRGAPGYVLVAPNGRLLAYLQGAPGVDLAGYVGQAMGISGQRSYRQELHAELIVVRSLSPVRLRGTP